MNKDMIKNMNKKKSKNMKKNKNKNMDMGIKITRLITRIRT